MLLMTYSTGTRFARTLTGDTRRFAGSCPRNDPVQRISLCTGVRARLVPDALDIQVVRFCENRHAMRQQYLVGRRQLNRLLSVLDKHISPSFIIEVLVGFLYLILDLAKTNYLVPFLKEPIGVTRLIGV